MERNARIQTLALALLGAFAWLCFDFASIPATVSGYIDDALSEEPAEPRREPTLIGRGDHGTADSPGALADGGGGGGRFAPQILLDDELPSGPVQPAQEERVIPSLPTIVFDSTPPLRDLEMAARLLGLGNLQKEELRRLLADAARDLDDLRHAANEQGATWYSIARRLSAGRERRDARALFDAAAELKTFAETHLRGTDETFEDARRRIIASHAEIVRAHLTPDQQVRWDRFSPDSLIDARPAPLPTFRMRTARAIRYVHLHARG